MVGERIWSDPYVVWDVDKHGGPLENHSGMTQYGCGCSQLACRLLLTQGARELAVEDIKRQCGFLVMQRDWGPNKCRCSGWYTQVGGCRIE